jgi:DNA-binding transcriptional regulator PaaX
MVPRSDSKVVNYEEIELAVLGAIHCNGPQCRNNPVHIWEILKLTQKAGVSERRTKDAIDFLKTKGYLSNDERGHPDIYMLTKAGEDYFLKLAKEKGYT